MDSKISLEKSDKLVIRSIISDLLKTRILDEKTFAHIVTSNAGNTGKVFAKSEVLDVFNELLKKKVISHSSQRSVQILKLLQTKSVRTASGVTPVTILTKPFPCPGKCIFCPDDFKMPKSYISSEPGAQRALANKFDPYAQTFNRLLALKNIGHPTEKIELIILGGTWSAYSESYQIWFIKRVFDALNDFGKSRRKNSVDPQVGVTENATLQQLVDAQKYNETAKTRCVGLVVETRPDMVTVKELIRFRHYGVTKVQIGIQSLDDHVLELNRRGHTVAQSAKAFKLLRQAGFKIHAHWMPNLYGSTPDKDIQDYRKIFSDDRFKPDEIKIYPCSLIPNTPLMQYYEKGKWKPYSYKELLKVLINAYKDTPEYCRVTRIIRDIPAGEIAAGNKISNFRQIVEKELQKLGIKPQEIRYREIKDKTVKLDDLELRVAKYATSVGYDYFLQYITKENNIAGFLRLSLPKSSTEIPELGKNAMIREVHVYGDSINIGTTSDGKAQHIGLGKSMIQKAKEIAKKNKYSTVSVISSVGTREYYKKLGFVQKELYQHCDLLK